MADEDDWNAVVKRRVAKTVEAEIKRQRYDFQQRFMRDFGANDVDAVAITDAIMSDMDKVIAYGRTPPKEWLEK